MVYCLPTSYWFTSHRRFKLAQFAEKYFYAMMSMGIEPKAL
jgi:hypothetical protein